jgi:membrane protein insertase Oxa1/YidC/SpoIIIJ
MPFRFLKTNREKKKKRERGQTTRHSALFIIFFIFFSFQKAGLIIYFATAFNVSNVHQILQNLHEINQQTSLYVWVWSSPAHWQRNERGTTSKMPTQAACSCRFDSAPCLL